ncbi:MAG TPA: flagellar assembly protein FliW [Candidatus Binatia bacterium]|nr:flagellar assembly protein FliW [Candidatus Binatia bacterium]
MPRTAEKLAPARRTRRNEGSARVSSQRFGDREVPADRILEVPEGLVGFPQHRRFARLECRAGSPFEWLLSLEDPELAFAVGDPSRLVRGYEAPRAEAAVALHADVDDVEFLALVAIPKDVRRMTIDLVAPIAIDRRRRVARQLLVSDPRWDAAVPILRRA